MTKRLLAVSWEMPPMYGPRATQVLRTLAGLATLGWRTTAVCLAPRRGGPHWLNGGAVEVPHGVELLRVPSPEEWTVARAAWRLVPALRDFPDSTRLWVTRAARAAERAAGAGACAGLITFAQPWSDHLVGLRVHRRTGLPWVAHFSDPWVDSPYATPRQRSIWGHMEREVIREATAVVFVTDQTADLVMGKYPAEWRRKASVVPHGFESGGALVTPSRPARETRPMRFVYTGRFYSLIRTPLALLQAVAEVNARQSLAGVLELLFVGPGVEEFEPEAAALGIAPLVQFRGRVPPGDAAAIAREADVLVVIDAPSRGASVFLPSKLVDYLPFRKPILGITPVEGASGDLLRRLRCPVAPPDDVSAIAAVLVDLIQRWRAGSLEVDGSFDRVAVEFDIRRTVQRLHDILACAFDGPREH